MEQALDTKLKISSISVTRTNHQKLQDVKEEQNFLFTEQFFNENGNKIKEIIYDENGEPEQIITFSYNHENQITEEFHDFLHDEINEKTTFTYKEGKLVLKHKEYSIGTYEKTEISYNEKGLITEIKVIDEDGEEEESEKYTYDQNNLIHHTKQNALVGKEFEHWLKYNDNRLTEETKWEASSGLTYTTIYDYSKNLDNPDAKVMNKKGEIVEAYRKTFDDHGKLIQTEIQTAHGGLKKYITSYHYDELDRLTFLETLDAKGNVDRRVANEYGEHGLLILEIKTEYEVGLSAIGTFTLKYEYTFH